MLQYANRVFNCISAGQNSFHSFVLPLPPPLLTHCSGLYAEMQLKKETDPDQLLLLWHKSLFCLSSSLLSYLLLTQYYTIKCISSFLPSCCFVVKQASFHCDLCLLLCLYGFEYKWITSKLSPLLPTTPSFYPRLYFPQNFKSGNSGWKCDYTLLYRQVRR